MEKRLRDFVPSDADRAWLGSVALLYGIPTAALPFVGLRWAMGPRWMLDGTWLGTALVAGLLVVFAAALLVGPFEHLVRPQLERFPAALRTAMAAVFFAFPWSAVVYWLVPKNATAGSVVEWVLVIGTPPLLAALLLERFRSVLASAFAFAAAAVVPLFVASDVRTPFVTLWTYGGVLADAFLGLRVAAAAAALGFAFSFSESEEGASEPLSLAGALAASALVAAMVAPVFGGRMIFDGAALAMPFVVLLSRRSLRLAMWAPKIALAQVAGSAAVAALALVSGIGEAAVPAMAHGAFAVVVGLRLATLLDRTPARVRIPLRNRR